MTNKTKLVTIATLALSSTMLLTACGNNTKATNTSSTDQSAQIEKDAESAATQAMATATTTLNQKNLDSAQTALDKVKDSDVKDKLTKEYNALKSRLTNINTATKLVSDYQKDAMNTGKYNSAKAAVAKLTDKNDAKLKADLEAKLAASKKQADSANAAKAAAASASNNASDNSVASNSNAGNSGTSNQYAGGATGGNTGSATPSTPAASNPTPSAPAKPAPSQPKILYRAWEQDTVTGKIIWQQDGIDGYYTALNIVDAWDNANSYHYFQQTGHTTRFGVSQYVA
ncbi:MAG: hypothetical protein FWF42_03335 [Streptococcaceae bacterium]|nr:hypothetical protein [Streptococcaceae bacterium]MCL2681137.1 hypothetical protein [Streptococcaceae bacterium]MCL2858703.1 hypothetical protein [Streptococcaceae bacterium]